MDDGRRKTHFVQYIDDKSLRRAFYQALLDIEWLPSKIHSAVMSELGLSLQKRKSDIEEARTLTLNLLVDECKARMRENGEQPRGGIHDSAVAEIAARHGMTAEALKQALLALIRSANRAMGFFFRLGRHLYFCVAYMRAGIGRNSPLIAANVAVQAEWAHYDRQASPAKT
jgi:hypothetical protein